MSEPLNDQIVKEYLPDEVRFKLTDDQIKLLQNEHKHMQFTPGGEGNSSYFLAFAYYREYNWPLNEFAIRHLTAKEINEVIDTSKTVGGLDTNLISDGLNTFGELYERIESLQQLLNFK